MVQAPRATAISNEFNTWEQKLVWLGTVEARDGAKAKEKAFKQLNIGPADQFRIIVRRD
jgi:hypothetical protein